jgi:lipopolysaccharide biosynthesis regulator YciM
LFKLLVSLFLSISIVQADEISQLLSTIKTAKPEQKRVLINKLKIMLRKSNTQTRINTIRQIQRQNHTYSTKTYTFNSSTTTTTTKNMVKNNINSNNTITHTQNKKNITPKRIGASRK